MNQSHFECNTTPPENTGVQIAGMAFAFLTVCVQLVFSFIFFILKRTRILELMHLQKRKPDPVVEKVDQLDTSLRASRETVNQISQLMRELSQQISLSYSNRSAPPSPIRDDLSVSFHRD